MTISLKNITINHELTARETLIYQARRRSSRSQPTSNMHSVTTSR